MEDIFKRLEEIPGIEGGWIINLKGETVVASSSLSFSREKLKNAGEVAVKGFQAVASTGHKTPFIEWRFENRRFFARSLTNGTLCILAETSVLLPALHAFLDKENAALEEIIRRVPVQVEAPAVMVEEPFFSDLALNLAKIIGPMATFIIEEKTRELGISKSSATKGQAIALVNGLCREIDDANLSYEFSKNMFKYLQE